MEFISTFNSSVSVFHNDNQNVLTVIHIDRRPFTNIFTNYIYNFISNIDYFFFFEKIIIIIIIIIIIVL